jgi:DNA polymerase-3 subunit gamma/tau
VTAGTAVDVIEIDGASNTGVDDVRELRENVKYLPSRLRAKIFIIDEVHMLSTSAFNALLKTLEEPPSHVKFIFATTEPHKVPITILSRCQRFDFKRIALPVVIDRLRYIVDHEGVAITDAALAMVARKGDGSMRDALSTLDQVLAFCGATVQDDDVSTLLGVVDRRLLVDVSRYVLERDSKALLEIVRQVEESGYSLRQFCQELVEYFRNLTLCCAIGDIAGLSDLSEAELMDIRQQAATAEIADLQRHVALLLKAEGEMAHTSFSKIVLEMALMKMAMLAPALPVQELLSRLDALRGALINGVASPTGERGALPVVGSTPHSGAARNRLVPSTAPAAPKNEFPLGAYTSLPHEGEQTFSNWPGFVAMVSQEKPMIGSLLEDARPLTVSQGNIELSFPPNSFHYDALNTSAMKGELGALAARYFGVTTVIHLKVMAGGEGAQSISEKKNLEQREKLRRIEDTALADPSVQAALEIFGGKLEKVEPLE